MYGWKQEAAGGGEVDRTSLTVVCERAGYSEIPGGLPSSAVTVDLSGNSLESLGHLSRLRHVVNLRLRDNRINRIHYSRSASPGLLIVCCDMYLAI